MTALITVDGQPHPIRCTNVATVRAIADAVITGTDRRFRLRHHADGGWAAVSFTSGQVAAIVANGLDLVDPCTTVGVAA